VGLLSDVAGLSFETATGNFEAVEFPGLIVTDSYWLWPNALHLTLTIVGCI
jgi:hypothetical protein